MDETTIIAVSVVGAAVLMLFVVTGVLLAQVCVLRKAVAKLKISRIRVQKLKMDDNANHAFHNATIVPDEELSKRGYSMYVPNGDLERGAERQAGANGLANELADQVDKKLSSAPPFLLQSIEEKKRWSKPVVNPVNPVARNARNSETNHNFIY